MSETADPVERALDLFVFAPLGAALYLRDVGPSFVHMLVARGRAEVDRHQERVQQHVTTVRSTGQVALAFGLPMVREQVRQRWGSQREQAPAPTPTDAMPAPAAAPAPTNGSTNARAWAPPAATPSWGHPVADAPSSAELPIPGYDALSASQVVERLTGLAPGELDAVHAYEAAHRQRRTILGKIEQLAG